MPSVTLAIGVFLTLLGAGAYFGTGQESVTALIPAFFGVAFAILGALARDESRLKLTMHIAVVLAIIGLAGSARGIPDLMALVGGQEIERPTAAVVQSVMALVCGLFVVLAIRSFVAARRARPN